MAESVDFELVDSSCRFFGISHVLGELAITGESATSEYIMYIKE